MGALRKWMSRFPGRLVGWAAAYALVLNFLVTGLLGAQMVASGDGTPGFALCLTGGAGGADPAAPVPLDHTVGKLHCLLCATGGHVAALPPFVAAMAAVAGAGTLLAPARDRDRRQTPHYLNPPARGPPLTA